MTERGLLDLIIARLPGLNAREKTLLCESLESERDLARRPWRDVEDIVGRRLAARWDADLVRLLAERDAHSAGLRGIGWVSWRDGGYPPLLRMIYDPPPVLFFRGSLPDSEKPLVAIVGTRKPSPAAALQAFDLAKGLGRGGLSVVSGLALGIDAMAHRGNVEGGTPAFAVLGSGVDEVYPASNRPLARSVLETGGALISEYPPGAVPRKWNFPARNRIISGLCRGVIVVEAPAKSGALITADFAAEHNRDLWVASAGLLEDGRFDRMGTRKLAEDGAGVARCASDILGAWNMKKPDPEPRRAFGQELSAGEAVSSLACSLGITL